MDMAAGGQDWVFPQDFQQFQQQPGAARPPQQQLQNNGQVNDYYQQAGAGAAEPPPVQPQPEPEPPQDANQEANDQADESPDEAQDMAPPHVPFLLSDDLHDLLTANPGTLIANRDRIHRTFRSMAANLEFWGIRTGIRSVQDLDARFTRNYNARPTATLRETVRTLLEWEGEVQRLNARRLMGRMARMGGGMGAGMGGGYWGHRGGGAGGGQGFVVFGRGMRLSFQLTIVSGQGPLEIQDTGTVPFQNKCDKLAS